jgi:uncharacterized protein YcaQ
MLHRVTGDRTATLSAAAARRLLLHGQHLLDDPTRRATPAAVRRVVERLGYLQLDSINIVARAHHLILAARLDGYRREHLRMLLEDRRQLFEHWTHDASAIPVKWFVAWRHRCRRMVENAWVRQWLGSRVGPSWSRTVRKVFARVRDDGPLMSKDFKVKSEGGGTSEAWWGWKPAKAALEYLFWRGDLTVAARRSFQKVYDLTERCFPDLHAEEPPPVEEYVDRVCAAALRQLGQGTAREVGAYFGGVSRDEATAWCARAAEEGRIVPARIGGVDGTMRQGFAMRDWRRRLARAEAALAAEKRRARMRLLAPFDPVLRDRERARRLFGFDYRFEAFTPAAKRRYGYYVLPILRGEDLVGRCDLKLHRKQGVLEVKGLWWEEGRGTTKREHGMFSAAIERLAAFLGARDLRRKDVND